MRIESEYDFLLEMLQIHYISLPLWIPCNLRNNRRLFSLQENKAQWRAALFFVAVLWTQSYDTCRFLVMAVLLFWQCNCFPCDFIGLAGYLTKPAYVYQTYLGKRQTHECWNKLYVRKTIRQRNTPSFCNLVETYMQKAFLKPNFLSMTLFHTWLLQYMLLVSWEGAENKSLQKHLYSRVIR